MADTCVQRFAYCFDLGLLPLAAGVTMFCAIFICYTIAVMLDHLDPILPTISDTGIMKPEQYIFSQLINLACALAIMTFLMRFKVVQERLGRDSADNRKLLRISVAISSIGIVGAAGLTLVANFPDDTMGTVHYFGAAMTFGMGTLYSLMDAILSFKMYPRYNSKRVAIIRMCLATTSILGILTIFTASQIFKRKFNGDEVSKADRLHWKEGVEGRTAYIVSTTGEWVLAFAFNSYFFTYIKEFQDYTSSLRVRHKAEELARAKEEQQNTPCDETTTLRSGANSDVPQYV